MKFFVEDEDPPGRRWFGTLLRGWRRTLDLTMGDLAEALGTTVTFVSDIERGLIAPPRWTSDGVKFLTKKLAANPETFVKATIRSRAAFGLGGDVPAAGDVAKAP